MTFTQFNDEKNLQCADRCCACCAHGDDMCDGSATCLHPDRDKPGTVLSYHVCDGWKASAR